MVRTKLTPNHHRERIWTLPSQVFCQNMDNQQTKGTYPLKIKMTLPEQKQVNTAKGGNVIKTIRVRRKILAVNISPLEMPEYLN